MSSAVVNKFSSKFKELWKNRWFRHLVGGTVGGTLGFLYYSIWGCQGSCAITSSSVKMVGFGIVFGAIWIS